MKYTAWLLQTYPELKNEPSVKVHNYVKQAKKDTVYQRVLITLFFFILVCVLSFSIGYSLSKFNEIDETLAALISVVTSMLVSLAIEGRLRTNTIRNKLRELIDKNA
ncbi:hypothetical protein CS022_24540 [Veronia nyctiphanis]|uniref:Uncharacterized protein n=1 Tax=Veronia nyctiphanis TaxID=1278244 RepID=A0A4V1LR14_9GAMM|nr:hypothetical protein [Veronia nyctiphanis]RXJ66608.1 hypothetical protein CS022_24540 [Veronia nyctiphanis]